MPAPEIQFVRGQFQAFRATTRIHLGQVQRDIGEDDIIEFDGQTLKYGGEDFSVPSVKSAIREGWFVPEADTTSGYVPQPAGVKVHHATQADKETGEGMALEQVVEDEQVVGDVESNNARRDATLKGAPAPKAAPPRPGAKPAQSPQPPVKKMPVEEDSPIARPVTRQAMQVIQEEDQEAVPVGRIKSPAVRAPVVNVDNVLAVAREVTKLDSHNGNAPAAVERFARPKTGATESDVENVTAPPPRPKTLTTQVSADEGEVSIAARVGEATGDVSETRSGDTLEELLPDAASVGKPAPTVRCDFEWDVTRHWSARVQDAIDNYGDDPTMLQLIYDRESPSVVRQIVSKLARKG